MADDIQIKAGQKDDSAQPQDDQATTNRRAFDLNEGVEESDTTVRKPLQYIIPKIVQDKYPDLVELIKMTESMDDEEREYWFQVLPIMTDHQVQKFRKILETEKQQLEDLDKEYEQELTRLNEKHMLEWKEFETKEKRQALKQAETKHETTEKSTEEELLAKLSEL